jgi:hypothetical protein
MVTHLDVTKADIKAVQKVLSNVSKERLAPS